MKDTLTISEENSRYQKENSTLVRALNTLTTTKDSSSSKPENSKENKKSQCSDIISDRQLFVYFRSKVNKYYVAICTVLGEILKPNILTNVRENKRFGQFWIQNDSLCVQPQQGTHFAHKNHHLQYFFLVQTYNMCDIYMLCSIIIVRYNYTT